MAKLKGSTLNSNPFPDPRNSTPEGIVAVGGKLAPELVFFAYEKGIFPWPQGDGKSTAEEGVVPMLWFSPDPRGAINFDEFHLPRSFQKWLKSYENRISISYQKNFADVIAGCQKQVRKGQDGTWITSEVENTYKEIFKTGKIFCVEVLLDGELVAGLYGIISDCPKGKYFSGESMFHTKDNMSKVALVKTVEWLKENGFTWMDTQMVTPVIAAFGGKLISRDEFLDRIGV